MAYRTDHALVVPALSGAEIVCRVARIGDAVARFLHKHRAARLHRLGDEQTTVGLAPGGPAVPSRLIHSSMTVRRCRERKLAPVGAGPDEACVDIRPGSPAVGRSPYSLLVCGRVDHARVRRINRERSCAAGRTEARWEGLAGVRAEDDSGGLGQREMCAAVGGLPDPYARPTWDLRDCASRR